MHDLCSFSPATNPVVCTDAALMCCKNVSRGSWRKSIGEQAQGQSKSRRGFVGGGVEADGQQLIWQADRSLGNVDDHEVHNKRERLEEGAALGVVSRFGGDCRHVQNRVEVDKPFQVGIKSLPDGQAPGPAVLLWLPGEVPRQARFPINPDWHRQPVLRAVVWFDGRGGESRDAGRVPSKQKKNGSRGTNGVSENRGCSSWSSRAHAELLCAACVILWRMRMEKAKLSSEGDLKAPKQSELGAVQRRTGRTAGHRH